MHIHVFAKQMYKYTLWVSENWYPLRKIYYKCLSVRLGQEKFSCVIFVSIDIWGDWATELYIEVWDVCHAGGGRQGGGRVASLARRNVRDWNFRWISLSLSLALCCYCETLSCDDWLWRWPTQDEVQWLVDWAIILLDISTLICWQSPLSN